MAKRWQTWNISGALIQHAIESMPDDYSLKIEINGGSIAPYVTLNDDAGDALWNSDGPRADETLSQCIGRLLLIAQTNEGEN